MSAEGKFALQCFSLYTVYITIIIYHVIVKHPVYMYVPLQIESV